MSRQEMARVNISVAIFLVMAKLKDISKVRNEDNNNKRITNWKQKLLEVL